MAGRAGPGLEGLAALPGKHLQRRQRRKASWNSAKIENNLGARAFGRAAGLSCPGHVLFGEIARAINAKFNTAYSRNAAIGRAKRMGLAGLDPSGGLAGRNRRASRSQAAVSQAARTYRGQIPSWFAAGFEAGRGAAKLRCVEIEPRHLSLLELEPGDCRYPYGGDEEGEAITFCGHPRREGSSYCAAHFHLTRGTGAAPERAASQGLAAAGGGGMTRVATVNGRDNRQDEAAAAPSSHRASARADPACSLMVRSAGDELAALLRDEMTARPAKRRPRAHESSLDAALCR